MTTEEKVLRAKEIIEQQSELEQELYNLFDEVEIEQEEDAPPVKKKRRKRKNSVEIIESSDGDKPSAGFTKVEKRDKGCIVEGCESKHLARGMCSKHYWQEKSNRKSTEEPEQDQEKSNSFSSRLANISEPGKKANMYCDEEECMHQFVGTLPLSDNVCPECGSDAILLSKYQDDI